MGLKLSPALAHNPRWEVCKMADRWPTPKYNRLIDQDPQIVKVDLHNMEYGARPSAMPKNVKNDMTIKHVKGS